MHDLLAKFFETPNSTHYLAVRDAVRRESTFCSFSLALAEVPELLAAGQYGEARQRIAAVMPGAALSPRVHAWSMIAALELEDREDADLEQFLYQTCLQGIQATGDGSPRRPYIVTYSSDSHDVLNARGLQVTSQELTEKRGRRFDVMTCADGTAVWFDVTGLVVGSPQWIVARPTAAVGKPRTQAVLGAAKKGRRARRSRTSTKR